MQPWDWFAHSKLGWCHQHLGDKETAILNYETALRYRPGGLTVCSNLGFVVTGGEQKRRGRGSLSKPIGVGTEFVTFPL